LGQKANPYALRLGCIRTWHSRWFSRKKGYGDLLIEDVNIRKFIKGNFGHAGISKIEIERSAGKVRVIIWTARPGILIGRRGQEIEKIRDGLSDVTKDEAIVDVKEVKFPQLSAQLVAEGIAAQLEKRIAFRRAMKRAVQLTMQRNAKGIRVLCKGRLGGSEIARKEGYKQGSVPLGTFRADVDYGFTEARTTYGAIGIKVWIYTGDVLVGKEKAKMESAKEEAANQEKEMESQKKETSGEPLTNKEGA